MHVNIIKYGRAKVNPSKVNSLQLHTLNIAIMLRYRKDIQYIEIKKIESWGSLKNRFKLIFAKLSMVV